ncbi:hypothetical protein OEZ86_013597 [Tetradesmus obliquus]|nr:hypothetical protein OEZ86_013597 [Tetradesmus obliquus]
MLASSAASDSSTAAAWQQQQQQEQDDSAVAAGFLQQLEEFSDRHAGLTILALLFNYYPLSVAASRNALTQQSGSQGSRRSA